MEFDIDKQENFTCFPLVTMVGRRARINFKKSSYLHYFTTDENEEFYYSIQIFSRKSYFDEIEEKNLYFFSIDLYNYDDYGFKNQIMNNFDFYDNLEDIIMQIWPVSSFFLSHHKYLMCFSGEDEYSFKEYKLVTEKWKKEILG